MIRVLHELASLDGGGVDKLVYDYCLHMDRSKVQFDFLIYQYVDEGIYERELTGLGCRIYRIPVFKASPGKCLREMKRVVKQGKYDVVHTQRGSRGLFVLYFAKKYRVRRRIAHSHIAYEAVGKGKKCINRLVSYLTMGKATELAACGRDAAIYMWGKRAFERGKVRIIRNAIDTKAYAFSPEIRKELRQKMGLGERLTIGIVGRLSAQKNYPFLLRVMKELQNSSMDAVLLIIGRGEEEERLQKLARELGVWEHVVFMGIRTDVPRLLNVMDIFALPSLYEGLPVVLLEAQANGLPALISDRITDEMKVTDLITALPVGENCESLWAGRLWQMESSARRRAGYAEQVALAGYDINAEAKKLEEYYLR